MLLRMLLPLRLPQFSHFQCWYSRLIPPNNRLLPKIPPRFLPEPFSSFDTRKLVRCQLCANMRPATSGFPLASLPMQQINPLVLKDWCYASAHHVGLSTSAFGACVISPARTAGHTRCSITFSANRVQTASLSTSSFAAVADSDADADADA